MKISENPRKSMKIYEKSSIWGRSGVDLRSSGVHPGSIWGHLGSENVKTRAKARKFTKIDETGTNKNRPIGQNRPKWAKSAKQPEIE